MEPPDQTPPSPAAHRDRRSAAPAAEGTRSWPFIALRAAAALQATLVLAQAALSGHLLTGNDGARVAHQVLGTEVITWIALLQVVFAVLVWRPGDGPAWPIAVMVASFAAITMQIGMGFSGRLTVHIPLGVTILAVNLAVALALRRPAPAVIGRRLPTPARGR